ncbi:DUF6088 family protein [Marinoscillum pacificum]|uniref:DUF6088 family protein n=1 Tax=Marinoscillum pacificum TaxID=392723 RepID=UPI002157E056|nr:DUF6088 family protein [Marinoscillum pacificum]
MSTSSSLVKKRIEKMEPGSVFGYARFQKDKIEESALAMTLSRLSKEGKIMRIAKGKYYKPELSRFGPLRPKESAIIEALTTKNGQRIGYLTGIPVYNKLGLTSQVSNTLEIATNKPLPSKEVQGYRVKYQQRTVPIRDQDISLLQLLDAIKDIKNIPDSSPDQVLPVVFKQIKNLKPQEQQRLAKLALNYNAATRALLGAIFQKVGINVMLDQLSKSLNKLTRYNIGVSEQVLPDKRNWNIL